MSDPTISTAISRPHTMTQQHATAQLSGPGWKRLVQSLNSSEATERFDPVTVQCVLDFFTLGSTCGEFQALSRASIEVLDNILILSFIAVGTECSVAPSELHFLCPWPS
jgi:hypothetical protein